MAPREKGGLVVYEGGADGAKNDAPGNEIDESLRRWGNLGASDALTMESDASPGSYNRAGHAIAAGSWDIAILELNKTLEQQEAILRLLQRSVYPEDQSRAGNILSNLPTLKELVGAIREVTTATIGSEEAEVAEAKIIELGIGLGRDLGDFNPRS